MSAIQTSLGHLKRHIKYPATKKQLVEACNNMSDVPAADREWFTKAIAEGNYKNAEDVLRALLTKV